MQPSCSADRDFIKFRCRCQNAVYRCQRAACGSIKQPKFAAAAVRHFTALLQRFFQPFCSAAAALFVSYGNHPKLVNIPSADGSEKHLDERFLQQGSDAWKQARKGKINGSKAASALGWKGRQEMIDYAKGVKYGHVTNNINDAMSWGSMCEDHALATCITHMPCTKFERTGLWIKKDGNGAPWLAVSPDGIVDGNTVVEIKCPYMGGKPFPYRKVPWLYIPQC